MAAPLPALPEMAPMIVPRAAPRAAPPTTPVVTTGHGGGGLEVLWASSAPVLPSKTNSDATIRAAAIAEAEPWAVMTSILPLAVSPGSGDRPSDRLRLRHARAIVTDNPDGIIEPGSGHVFCDISSRRFAAAPLGNCFLARTAPRFRVRGSPA